MCRRFYIYFVIVMLFIVYKSAEAVNLYPIPSIYARRSCCLRDVLSVRNTNQEQFNSEINNYLKYLTKNVGNYNDKDEILHKGLMAENPRNTPYVIDTSIPNSETSQKAVICSKLQCDENGGPVCACNFNTGNVVSFKNDCDLVRHNCRFDTAFKKILNEICPWEYQSRRNADLTSWTLDYTGEKYYNK